MFARLLLALYDRFVRALTLCEEDAEIAYERFMSFWEEP